MVNDKEILEFIEASLTKLASVEDKNESLSNELSAAQNEISRLKAANQTLTKASAEKGVKINNELLDNAVGNLVSLELLNPDSVDTIKKAFVEQPDEMLKVINTLCEHTSSAHDEGYKRTKKASEEIKKSVNQQFREVYNKL